MTRVFIVLLFVLGGSVAVLADSPSVSQLQPGDRLHVSYRSRGCFHDQSYEIDFERAGSLVARNGGQTVALSPEEASGLDKLFQFYDSLSAGGCTTRDDISITHFRDGQKIASAHRVDDTCASHEVKGVTRL